MTEVACRGPPIRQLITDLARRIAMRLTAATGALAAATLVIAGCGSSTPEQAGKPASPEISVPGKRITTQSDVHPVVPSSAVAYLTRDSQTVRVEPSGPLSHPAVIRIPLSEPPRSGALAVVLTSESPSGPWQVLPGTVTDDGRYVEATVQHLSYFSAFLVDWHAILQDLKGAFSQFTDGAYSNATGPACSGESQARQDGYSVAATSGNTVLACYGMENGNLVLKVVNNRRYPLLVAHGLPITGGSSGGDVYQKSASLLNLGDALIFPQDETDFGGTVQPGRRAVLAGDYAPVAGYLDALSTGVSAWLTIVTRGGSADNPSKDMEIVDEMLTLDGCRAAAMSGDTAAIQGSCFTPDVFAKVFGAFWGVVATVVQSVSEFANWVRATLNAIADSVDGRSSFEIVASRANASGLASFLGAWGVHDGTLCIGTLLSVDGPASRISNPACDGTSSWGYTSAWGCQPGTSGASMVCNQYYTVHFTSNADGSITGTIAGNPIYINTNDVVVEPGPGYFQAFKIGDKFTLVHTAAGLLTATYSGGSTGYWCNYNTISAANRPKCGA
jgi:hypothetical protein